MGISAAFRYDKYLRFVLLVPTVLLLIALTVYPLVYAVVASLHSIDIRTGERTFIGLANFNRVFNDGLFWNAARNTGIYVAVAVSVEFFLGLGLALFLNQEFRGRGVFRSLLMAPMMLPPIVCAIIFKVMYIPDFGILNWLLGLVGIEGMLWEASVHTALMSVILVDIWEWTPFMFLILLAGLQAIPEELYESAIVDGANPLQLFRRVVFPLLTPSILIAVLLRLMDTLRIFDQVFVMTGGGPANATETLSLYVYRHAFRFFNVGYATAMSFLLLVVTVVISLLFMKWLRTEEVLT